MALFQTDSITCIIIFIICGDGVFMHNIYVAIYIHENNNKYDADFISFNILYYILKYNHSTN